MANFFLSHKRVKVASRLTQPPWDDADLRRGAAMPPKDRRNLRRFSWVAGASQEAQGNEVVGRVGHFGRIDFGGDIRPRANGGSAHRVGLRCSGARSLLRGGGASGPTAGAR